jgi:hypothetical protein
MGLKTRLDKLGDSPITSGLDVLLRRGILGVRNGQPLLQHRVLDQPLESQCAILDAILRTQILKSH